MNKKVTIKKRVLTSNQSRKKQRLYAGIELGLDQQLERAWWEYDYEKQIFTLYSKFQPFEKIGHLDFQFGDCRFYVRFDFILFTIGGSVHERLKKQLLKKFGLSVDHVM